MDSERQQAMFYNDTRNPVYLVISENGRVVHSQSIPTLTQHVHVSTDPDAIITFAADKPPSNSDIWSMDNKAANWWYVCTGVRWGDFNNPRIKPGCKVEITYTYPEGHVPASHTVVHTVSEVRAVEQKPGSRQTCFVILFTGPPVGPNTPNSGTWVPGTTMTMKIISCPQPWEGFPPAAT